ncbi:cob(I)yrinic acid a,c-diamide adenosyltransferase [Xanthobacter tagetidis]|jgi:cob(I)alamin adenosyltransferase|uniref:Corrinoid adenosyltransferase n=1 Tax=Xanthobacter tagetidis TaxID=60216 RepID=A0A3L7AG36_9HYPH|nr:cob(I)yrinic acid a,c-diamide adenosyltransferase [Xanthobacter tagetidis]MBB6306719.1 cob(I)alamin adenosyltransferase [Xanthobacter tagetidis]RLP78974.1 cob(I)yrinic acid a,c-diamide adenosyltransferase [Xanthobacter tagetidis]
MVKLNKIYTRTGDDGTTGLGTGARVRKYDLRVAAYGAVDEANAAIGIARLHLEGEPALSRLLERVQNDLFDLGADLCTPPADGEAPGAALRIVPSQVERLEADIDTLNAELSPLTSFVLPGGSAASAHLHLARTICRRAERDMVELSHAEGEAVGAPAIAYVNRLSDLLFVAGRYANDRGKGDVLWVPGASR